MLTSRALTFALLAFGTTTTILAQPERPYAPELFNRDALDEQPTRISKRSVADGQGDRPYSPDLYFRRALTSDEMSNVQEKVEREARPTQTYGKRALCRRDADCGAGFCGKNGSCLEKRSVGAYCADSASACSDGHFCSTVNFRCQQKRSLGGSCRTSQGCSDGLACLNFSCQEQIFKDNIDNFKQQLKDWKKDWPSPSGTPSKKRELQERQDFLQNLQDLPQELQDQFEQFTENFKQPAKSQPSGTAWSPKWLAKRGGSSSDDWQDQLGENWQEFEDDLKQWWKPQQSGSPRQPKWLQARDEE